MTYNSGLGRFEVTFPYDTASVEFIRKVGGWRWDKATRCWIPVKPGDADAVNRMVAYADDAAKTQMGESRIGDALAQVAAKEQNLITSRAVDADVTIPAPASLEYLGYQKAGIVYASARPNTLIGDEMGLGKTIQAIGVMNAESSTKRILVVCPASLKLNWRKEISKWDVNGRQIFVFNSGKAKIDWSLDGVYILNYELLKKFKSELRSTPWDIIVVDECHYLKNPAADRTKMLLGHRSWNKQLRQWDTIETPIPAARRIFLTGTPLVNRPNELWTLAQALDPEGLGRSKSAFEKRYCGAHQGQWGWVKDGATNLDELQERMRSTFMIRRLKQDVLKELPAKRRQVITIDDTMDNELRERNQKMLSDLQFVQAKQSSTNMWDNEDMDEDNRDAEPADGTLTVPQMYFEEMSRLRHDNAIAKLPFIIEHLHDILDANGKVVVMCWHHDVVDALKAEFGDIAVAIDGRNSTDERDAAVTRFQTDSTCRLFIGTIRAAGVGLTLTASSTVIFAELDWTPGNVTQAEDRCHRIGQTEPVLVQHIVMDGTIDARMAELIVSKQAVIDAALDTQKAPVVAPVFTPAPEPKPAKQQREWPADLPKLSDTQIEAIHTIVRMLAGSCDGAFSEDHMGFNKMDTVFGHSLADAPKLSPKQAVAAQKMVRKYTRQIPKELMAIAIGDVF